jgi:hypothetical protein
MFMGFFLHLVFFMTHRRVHVWAPTHIGFSIPSSLHGSVSPPPRSQGFEASHGDFPLVFHNRLCLLHDLHMGLSLAHIHLSAEFQLDGFSFCPYSYNCHVILYPFVYKHGVAPRLHYIYIGG